MSKLGEEVVGDLMQKVARDVTQTMLRSVHLLDDHEERFVVAVGAAAGAIACAAASFDQWKPSSDRADAFDAVISAIRDIAVDRQARP